MTHAGCVRWPIVAIVAGLLAMHGLTSAHTINAATAMRTTSAGHASMAETTPGDAGAAKSPVAPLVPGHGHMTAMSACVALPPLTLLALMLVAANRRQHPRPARPGVTRRRRQQGRDPPCPPPRVRGVCLT